MLLPVLLVSSNSGKISFACGLHTDSKCAAFPRTFSRMVAFCSFCSRCIGRYFATHVAILFWNTTLFVQPLVINTIIYPNILATWILYYYTLVSFVCCTCSSLLFHLDKIPATLSLVFWNNWLVLFCSAACSLCHDCCYILLHLDKMLAPYFLVSVILWLVLFCQTAHDWYHHFLLCPLLLSGVISLTWTKFCGANRRARDIVVHLSKCRIFLQQDKIRVIDVV